jgi:hypothetical protein
LSYCLPVCHYSPYIHPAAAAHTPALHHHCQSLNPNLHFLQALQDFLQALQDTAPGLNGVLQLLQLQLLLQEAALDLACVLARYLLLVLHLRGVDRQR